jgi:hypothetical protein
MERLGSQEAGKLEGQEARKLESIGDLASGGAHGWQGESGACLYRMNINKGLTDNEE